MTRQVNPTTRHRREACYAKVAPFLATAERPSEPRHDLPGLTRQYGQATPPLMFPNCIALPDVFAPTLPDHRTEVRFKGLAARVMEAT